MVLHPLANRTDYVSIGDIVVVNARIDRKIGQVEFLVVVKICYGKGGRLRLREHGIYHVEKRLPAPKERVPRGRVVALVATRAIRVIMVGRIQTKRQPREKIQWFRHTAGNDRLLLECAAPAIAENRCRCHALDTQILKIDKKLPNVRHPCRLDVTVGVKWRTIPAAAERKKEANARNALRAPIVRSGLQDVLHALLNRQ